MTENGLKWNHSNQRSRSGLGETWQRNAEMALRWSIDDFDVYLYTAEYGGRDVDYCDLERDYALIGVFYQNAHSLFRRSVREYAPMPQSSCGKLVRESLAYSHHYDAVYECRCTTKIESISLTKGDGLGSNISLLFSDSVKPNVELAPSVFFDQKGGTYEGFLRK